MAAEPLFIFMVEISKCNCMYAALGGCLSTTAAAIIPVGVVLRAESYSSCFKCPRVLGNVQKRKTRL